MLIIYRADRPLVFILLFPYFRHPDIALLAVQSHEDRFATIGIATCQIKQTTRIRVHHLVWHEDSMIICEISPYCFELPLGYARTLSFVRLIMLLDIDRSQLKEIAFGY